MNKAIEILKNSIYIESSLLRIMKMSVAKGNKDIDLIHAISVMEQKCMEINCAIKILNAAENSFNLTMSDVNKCDHNYEPCEHEAVWEFDQCTKCGKIN